MGSGTSGLSGSGGVNLIGGANDPEITDDIHDFYLPQDIKDKLPEIEKIKTYSDLQSYLADKGIVLDTDLDALKNGRENDEIDAVRDLSQKIAVGIETYESIYGKDALKSLKRVNLYDDTLDTRAAYHYNMIGENDPLAGTIRFRDWNVTGRDVFHELGHAFQDSQKAKGEDAVSFSNRVAKSINIPKSAYTGSSDVANAEMMAEAFAHGFTRGSKNGQGFVSEMKKKQRRWM